MDTFGSRIKSLRIEKKLQQSDVADALNVHKGSVSNWETDRRFPDRDMIKKLCDLFEVTADYLLGFSDVKEFKIPDVDVFEELSKLVCTSADNLSEKDKEKILSIVKVAWPE